MPVDNDIYNRLPTAWWGETESLSLLRTGINPARFGYFRTILADQLTIAPTGKRLLDIDCGGGVLAEEFARIGCQVTGIDPSPQSIQVALAYAQHA